MSIIAASIESNGWVLRLTLAASLGTFASYTLDPDGTPRVMLGSSHSGFAQSGGQAVATSQTRALVATKPLRKPAQATNAGVLAPAVIDETDLGGGQIQVRLALSEHIYATDTAVTLSVAGGWRTAEAAATGISVSNGSTIVCPVPVFRWADVPYQRRTGAFFLDLIAFSHHPNALQPVAGVKFTVTDGTTVKTYWTTALATSTSYGDTLRCYRVQVDPTVATALTAGLLRCDAEVYPWLGVVRSTDPSGTRSMTGLTTAAFATAAQAPFTVAWDPAGTRYAPGYVCVDPATGSATASAVTVGATWAAAKAGTRARDVTTAIQAGYLLNRTLPAANGQSAQTRSVDGLMIGLVAATHAGIGTTAVTTGIAGNECWPAIFGDPDNAAPRTNCILQTGTAQNVRLGRMRLADLAFEVGTSTLFISSTIYLWFDNVEGRGKSGQTTNAVAFTSTTPPAGFASTFATRTRWWQTGTSLRATSGIRPLLLRNCEWARRSEACAILGGRLIQHLDTTVSWYTGSNYQTASSGWNGGNTGLGDIGSQEDVIIAGCDLRSASGRVWLPAKLDAASAATPLDSIRRQVFANNVCERLTSGSPEPFWAMGEDDNVQMSYNIIEGNTFAGERSNCLYSDPLPVTVADTDTLNNSAFANRIANNCLDWAATKHDTFNDSQSLAVRAAAGDPRAHGYRPQAIGCWSVLYGVGFAANVDFGRHPSAGNFQFEYLGRRSVQIVGGTPLFTNDGCKFGSNAGQGDYKAAVTSLVVGRGLAASSDRDRLNLARIVPFAAGSIETSGAVQLSPDASRSATRAAVTALGWTATLVPAPARSADRALATALGIAFGIGPALARHPQLAAATGVGWAATLAPGDARSLLLGLATAISIDTEPTIMPGDGWNALAGETPILFPSAAASRLRTLKVYADPRTLPAGE